MNSTDLRQTFLEFFQRKDHKIIASSSLVPARDPSLLFTNAGMVQFKDIFTGKTDPAFKCAVSAQRCVRAGGKHNDLENVGYTRRHHTLFEMLGNFSFGAYFKTGAIQYAWEFLTETLALPADRLWVTVHETDDEAATIWAKTIGVPESRIVRLGDADNFWVMGDTGPCGPCSEIFYDHGPTLAGGPPGSAEAEGDRYVEIWNLVFMQYERFVNGDIKPLPTPCVDTGMGLERIVAVLQKVSSGYDTDLFEPLISATAKAAGLTEQADIASNHSLKVIADHIRSIAFLIADGILPGNEGRGYVLRRIIRRALRHENKLQIQAGFLAELTRPLVQKMGSAYPELAKAEEHIREVITQEAALFGQTLDQGLELLENALDGLAEGVQKVSGDILFRLYDTYGFPPDLAAAIARERGLEVDMDEFDQAMEEQRRRARMANRFGDGDDEDKIANIDSAGDTCFTGYQQTEEDALVQALYLVGPVTEVDKLEAGDAALVLLASTPFYAEAGGQVGDTGYLVWKGGSFRVTNTTRQGDNHLHHGHLEEGSLKVADKVTAKIDIERREQIRLNHSATHLLHASLREILGDRVAQKGSLVDADRLRFDFSCPKPLTQDQLMAIENLVNTEIRRNTEVDTEIMPPDDAQAKGALALFGEKYDSLVRVLTMGKGFSIELCGGTHVKRTGDIGIFRIVNELGIAANVRRIEAVTGNAALVWLQQNEAILASLQTLLKTKRHELVPQVSQLQAQKKGLQKTVQQLTEELAVDASRDLAGQAQQIGAVRVLVTHLDGADVKTLMTTLDYLKNHLGSAVILLATVAQGKVSLVAGVTKDVTDRITANELVQQTASMVGARGGGRADMARAGGGEQPEKLPEALAFAETLVRAKLEKK